MKLYVSPSRVGEVGCCLAVFAGLPLFSWFAGAKRDALGTLYLEGVVVLIGLLSVGVSLLKDYLSSRRTCRHGQRVGARQDGCPLCVEERLRAEQEKREKALDEEKRVAEASARAARIRTHEVKERDRLLRARVAELDDLEGMASVEFERQVGVLLAHSGFSAVELTPRSHDHGVDLVARRAGRRWVAQCKRWNRSRAVGRPDLQRLVGAMKDLDADEAMFVTTSSYSEPAREFANRQGIRLLGGVELARLIREVRGTCDVSGMFTLLCPECEVETEFSCRDDVTAKRCLNGHQVTANHFLWSLENSSGPRRARRRFRS